MLKQTEKGISTGFEPVQVSPFADKMYRVFVETYADTNDEAEAIAQRLRRDVEFYERPMLTDDGVFLPLHCYCKDKVLLHKWNGTAWDCSNCGKENK